ncbi:hypothetical protein [Vibrio sp. F74]|uniref:hypothetical protein n=1 Tax=Vibrio sp. F74 TaxID=700020 RepID=UPI0036F1BAF5
MKIYILHNLKFAPKGVCPGWSAHGKQIMSHGRRQRTSLTLSVYKENEPSFIFYRSQGFIVISEQIDEHTGHQEFTMTADR